MSLRNNQKPYQIITNSLVWGLKNGQPAFSPKTVVIADNTIESITDKGAGNLLLSQSDVTVINGEGCYLTPGLIEPHINGALGCDFNKAGITPIQTALKQLPKHGITHLLPTIITASTEDMLSAIHTQEEVILQQQQNTAQIIGIHLEGPFINHEKRGIHPEKSVSNNIDALEHLLSPNIKMVTLAPEKDPEGQLINLLIERGIKVLAGHSLASAEQMAQAVNFGVTGATHLFNAMQNFHHRKPGLLTEALINPNVFVEIITDGLHVHPKAVQLAILANGIKRTLLTADSINLAGMPDGTTENFAGQSITIAQGKPINSAEQLAGGGLLLDDCVRNIVRWDITDFASAIYMATTSTAAFLGKEDTLGHLTEKRTANLVLWNQNDLSIKHTWINGKTAFEAAASVPC